MVSDYKKHQMLVAGSVGLVLGIFIFLAFWFVTHRWFSAFIIPVTCLIGVAQAYLAPEPE